MRAPGRPLAGGPLGQGPLPVYSAMICYQAFECKSYHAMYERKRKGGIGGEKGAHLCMTLGAIPLVFLDAVPVRTNPAPGSAALAVAIQSGHRARRATVAAVFGSIVNKLTTLSYILPPGTRPMPSTPVKYVSIVLAF